MLMSCNSGNTFRQVYSTRRVRARSLTGWKFSSSVKSVVTMPLISVSDQLWESFGRSFYFFFFFPRCFCFRLFCVANSFSSCSAAIDFCKEVVLSSKGGEFPSCAFTQTESRTQSPSGLCAYRNRGSGVYAIETYQRRLGCNRCKG